MTLAWAGGYNVLAIAIAVSALQWAGITMPPALAAILMSVSTVVVALNAQTFRRLDLRLGRDAETPSDTASSSNSHSRPSAGSVSAADTR